MLNVIRAMWFRNFLVTIRSFADLFTIFFWPLMLPISMALFSTFINSHEAFIILFIGSISWAYAYAAQQDASYTFVKDIWYRSVKKLGLVPTSAFRLIVGNWTYGIVRSLIVFLLGSGISLFFGFNIFSINLIHLAAILFGMNLFGLFLGVIVSAAIFRFGSSAEVLVWSLTDGLILISGIYYPITILPETIRWVALLSPLTYALENLRGIFLKGIFDYGLLFNMYALVIVYIFIAWLILRKAEKYAMRTGFFQRYD